MIPDDFFESTLWSLTSIQIIWNYFSLSVSLLLMYSLLLLLPPTETAVKINCKVNWPHTIYRFFYSTQKFLFSSPNKSLQSINAFCFFYVSTFDCFFLKSPPFFPFCQLRMITSICSTFHSLNSGTQALPILWEFPRLLNTMVISCFS